MGWLLNQGTSLPLRRVPAPLMKKPTKLNFPFQNSPGAYPITHSQENPQPLLLSPIKPRLPHSHNSLDNHGKVVSSESNKMQSVSVEVKFSFLRFHITSIRLNLTTVKEDWIFLFLFFYILNEHYM